MWEGLDRILAGWRALSTQLPKIAEDPRAYPRESMLIAAVVALGFMLLVLAFFAIADGVNAAAARRRLGFDPRRARRLYLMRLWLLVLLLALPLIALAPYTATGSKPCGSCHAITDVVGQWKNGAHAQTGCWGCHSAGGLLGALEASAIDVVRISGGTSRQGVVSSSRCLSCHQAIATEPIEINRLRVSHAEMIDAGMDCLLCHRGTGHTDPGKTVTLAAARGRAPVVRSLMSRCLVCHDGRTAASDCDVCHVDGPLDKAVASGSDKQTTLLPTCKGCHSAKLEKKCVDCHGLELPHPAGVFIRQHAGLSAKDPALCVRCHEMAHSYESCGCHQDANLHGTYSEWFPIHGTSATATNGGAGCRCHSQPFCARCHDQVMLSPTGP
ncbi:MAG: hypothetical protein CVT67_01610 [Actinobacteria bacterium HGW-Actinobacteria-7]|jgi:nitrate/TMAO reductase-like tetraheme cytochrome c subunit|nr:MAG: hypothetical protein CVT67_01610 [Actinobacteria bacterium HGW-Actinobacteria-7]